jgi:hypothetical protein
LRVIARVPITFEVLSGGTTHAPMVIASVGGTPAARYILDTGSDVHLLNEDLADELGLEKRPGEEGTDHSGSTMPSWSVDDVALAIGDASVTLTNVVVIPAPPPFVAFGVRGILSPQHLHPTAFAVIDMTAHELLLVDGSDAEVAALLRERSPSRQVLQLKREPAGMTVITAAIEPFAEVATLLDTGGKRTEFAAAAVPGLASGEAVDLGGGVSGGRYHGGAAGQQTLIVGGARLEVPDLAIRAGDMHPKTDGLIGMDVLRGTVVACATDTARPLFWVVG